MTRETFDAFVAEYRALCEKHGVTIECEGGYADFYLLDIEESRFRQIEVPGDFFSSIEKRLVTAKQL